MTYAKYKSMNDLYLMAHANAQSFRSDCAARVDEAVFLERLVASRLSVCLDAFGQSDARPLEDTTFLANAGRGRSERRVRDRWRG